MILLYRVLEETYRIVLDSGVFILLGFFLAGVLHEFVDTARIGRILGGRNLKSILTAALVGAPLPLCSCGVLPTAVALRKKGASREATVSFLISTPETGVDSVLITYGLLGPVLAVVRPLAAIVTAVGAGLLSLVAGGGDGAAEEGSDADVEPVTQVGGTCEDGTCEADGRRGRAPWRTEGARPPNRPIRLRDDDGRAGLLASPRLRRDRSPRRPAPGRLLPPLPPVAAPLDGRHGARRDSRPTSARAPRRRSPPR